MRFDRKVEIASVYQIRNKINGMAYVGSSRDTNFRWNRHLLFLEQGKHWNPILQASWNNYGAEAFVFEILEKLDHPEEAVLRDRERQFMVSLDTITPKGYNVATDTTAPMSGRKHSDATRAQMKKSHTGLPNTPEANRKIGEANSRRVWTPEMRAVRAEIGRRRQGKKYGPVSEQARQNIAVAAKKRGGPKPGWKMSEEGCKNVANARRKHLENHPEERNAAGERFGNYWRGRKKSVEHRRKIGEANRRRKSHIIGRVRMTAAGIERLVKPEDVDLCLSQGWKKGRKSFNPPTLI